MTTTIITGLLWFAALGCGVIGGVYFAFSAFIMTSLSRVDHSKGIAVMTAINSDILKSVFMPLFIGTTFASVALTTMATFRWGEPGSVAICWGGTVYVIGMFLVTIVGNVPLNTALAVVSPSGVEAKLIWESYLKNWVFWNSLRMIASLAATALFIGAISVR
jgi:uncharacterized membrane protein